MTPEGRFALRVRARGAGGDALVFDPFADTPAVLLEQPDRLDPAPGWPRAIADALKGMRIESIRGRLGDRLVVADVATLSRFGVLSRYRLVVELVPRFGNLVLLRDDVVVAAAREFTTAQNSVRAIQVGERYAPPPLPQAKPSLAALATALDACSGPHDASAVATAERALRACIPLVPRLVATSLVVRAAAGPPRGPEAAEALLAAGQSIVEAAAASIAETGDVYVYKRDGRIVQVHVVPLAQFDDAEESRSPSMLDAFAAALVSERDDRTVRGAEQRRATLRRRLAKHIDALQAERALLERELEDSGKADRLRVTGDLLYAHHAEIAPGATSFAPPERPDEPIALDPELDAKGNAAAIFKRYRKTVAKRSHVGQRLERNASAVAAAEELLWEVERAEPASLEELEPDVDRMDRPSRPERGRPQARRTALEFALADDARIFVGRSPQNNADLTFRIARPDDLWFHARGVPGAHVVLRIDGSRAATVAELRGAAELAAYHSKARTSGLVPVDYTPRKYVRKRPNALPGLVWYTNAKTIDVTPKPAP